LTITLEQPKEKRDGMVKRATIVILCIFIAILASAVSLRLYRPVPATGPQVAGATPAKQPSLADLPAAILSLGISDEGPCIRGWAPRDQQHIIARVLAWLKTTAPYEGKIPPSPTAITTDYVGPSQLHLTTPDHRHLSIYPAYYYTVSKQNGWTEVQANYIPDVIVLWSPTGVSYFKSAQLYVWLKTDQWKMEFVPE
jgi:hypothetical protein